MRQETDTQKTTYPEIKPSGNKQFSPLSFQQERVLYLHKLSSEGALWNRISCKKMLGDIDIPSLKKVIEALIERHTVLKTKVSIVGGEPRQSQHERLEGAFQYIDISAQPEADLEEKARAILNREYQELLPLENGELFKAILVQCSETETWLILKLHHIISDATTFRILWDDLKLLYNSQSGEAETLPPLDIEYSDYSYWLRKQFGEENTKEQEAYWLDQFSGEIPRLDLPTDFSEPPNLTFKGAVEKQLLPKELIKRLQSFSFKKRVIPFSTMLSAYYLLLHNYCHQDDIVIGSVFLGRHYNPQVKRLAGFFANTVALRAQLEKTQTVEEFVKYVHTKVTAAHEMQDYPLERLVDKLDLDREHQRNPLFRALFNMVTGHEEKHTFKGIQQEGWLEPEISATQVDFFLDFHMNAEESDLRIEYNADIFSKATIQRMLRHYIVIVEKIMDSPNTNIGELGMLNEVEKQKVLSFSEGETVSWNFDQGVVGLLEERAEQTPEQTALLFADQMMSNGQFNKKVNQLAATLIDTGVADTDIVAIMVDRSPEMMIGLFAILKVGAAYLPIDPTFPQQRIEYILQDSGAKCLLSQEDAGQTLEQSDTDLSLKYIPIDQESSYSGNGNNIGKRLDGSNPAYVIYTSGSTGKPKGVIVEHSALMNTLQFMEAKYPLTEKTILLKTNFTFDVSCTELFGWLYDSGRLALLDKGAEKDPSSLIGAIGKFGATHIDFVPSMLDAFLAGLKENDIPTIEKLEYVFVAGEALKPDLVNRFYRMINTVKLENLYGPTEAAIYATWYPLPRKEELKQVSIGKPLTNTRSYVLDENLELLPVGVVGELCLSGAGLARGYMNNPELTDEKFCRNPHWEGERIYRTGDLAKWDDEGLIQFLGRGDGQLKIRGFRVEIGEVERKLLGCRDIAEAVVTTRADQFGQVGLVAYVTTKQGQKLSTVDIRKELAAWLPCYMIPDFIKDLEELPRLPSGKINIHALLELEWSNAPSTETQVAATELEQIVIGIAEKLLNTSDLDPDSNFFQLGGNSLLTLRFIAALDETLGTSLSVMDFLELPTISEIAKLIENSDSYVEVSSEVVLKRKEGIVGANKVVQDNFEGAKI
ncbi:MAG: amino acid adenylation domain-containing protein [Rhodospirillales bacterium]|nr:amino acid adenylation domain-containing protein [Rhodospirillales bacterium]